MPPAEAIGLDYGTNSGRAVAVDCADGRSVGTHVFDYPSGEAGDPARYPGPPCGVDREECERNTGLVIVECFRQRAISPEEVPAVLVAQHGPFTWGATPMEAVAHARVLEFVARMETRVRLLAPDAARPDAFLVDRHFLRKHGRAAYYGQR